MNLQGKKTLQMSLFTSTVLMQRKVLRVDSILLYQWVD